MSSPPAPACGPAQQGLEALAYTAATYDLRAGRSWRPMSDTTRDPIIAGRSPLPWTSWQRSEDYYSEGQLVWLEIDTRIRELSGDTASLDDFARRFFGVANGSFETLTYDFDEVIDTLNEVAPFDWKGLMIERLKSTEPGAPLGGLERGGYRLVYRGDAEQLQRQYGHAVGVGEPDLLARRDGDRARRAQRGFVGRPRLRCEPDRGVDDRGGQRPQLHDPGAHPRDHAGQGRRADHAARAERQALPDGRRSLP
jgi:hypothetical protein